MGNVDKIANMTNLTQDWLENTLSTSECDNYQINLYNQYTPSISPFTRL